MRAEDRRVGFPDAYQGLPGNRQTIDGVCTETELTQEQIEHVPSSLGTHNLLREDRSYDGWCNYETWAVHLWLMIRLGFVSRRFPDYVPQTTSSISISLPERN